MVRDDGRENTFVLFMCHTADVYSRRAASWIIPLFMILLPRPASKAFVKFLERRYSRLSNNFSLVFVLVQIFATIK